MAGRHPHRRSRLCLLVGATGKSAQLPLYVWLPDAMEGPTPVSALIHAATMVTAGVYMIARTHFLFDRSPFALSVVAIVGAATAIFAATIGLVQNDIKRVLAYSTISQLGYMFLGCGVAAYSAAIFHLMTHAFFKALLFLAAGSVIHAIGGEQDMRKMGGLRKTHAGHFLDHDRGGICHRWISSARRLLLEGRNSLRGIPAAVRRQDRSGSSAWSRRCSPRFYMFRLWYMTFFGESRSLTTSTRMRAPGQCSGRSSFLPCSRSAAAGSASSASHISWRRQPARA